MAEVKWEYNLIFFDTATQAVEKIFNGFGRDGWEAVNIHIASFNGPSGLGWIFFKRPIKVSLDTDTELGKL